MQMNAHQSGLQQVGSQADQAVFVPLTDVAVNIQINDTIAITSIAQTFQNPSCDEPQEEAKG